MDYFVFVNRCSYVARHMCILHSEMMGVIAMPWGHLSNIAAT